MYEHRGLAEFDVMSPYLLRFDDLPDHDMVPGCFVPERNPVICLSFRAMGRLCAYHVLNNKAFDRVIFPLSSQVFLQAYQKWL